MLKRTELVGIVLVVKVITTVFSAAEKDLLNAREKMHFIMQTVKSAGKYVTSTKRGKICSGFKAREKM